MTYIGVRQNNKPIERRGRLEEILGKSSPTVLVFVKVMGTDITGTYNNDGTVTWYKGNDYYGDWLKGINMLFTLMSSVY